MRITSLARRSVATLSVTALLAAAGFSSGLTVGVANAQTVLNVQREGGGDPTAVNNATAKFQVNGSDFMPATQQSVTLRPVFTAPGQGDISTTVESTGTCGALPTGTVPPDARCNGPLVFSAQLSGSAPGDYSVIVTQDPMLSAAANEIDTVPNPITVLSVGPASAATVGANGTTPGALTITGTNIFRGARVVFYKTDNGIATTPDDGLVFTPTTYATPTRVDGTYTANGSQADGLHIVRVFNNDQQNSPGAGPAFVQPRISGISPSTLGQGATGVPVTVTGGGFDANASASYSDPNVSVSAAPTATNATTLVVPTSVAPTTTLGTKSITVRGTGGAFATAANVLTISERPQVTANLPTRGQGSSAVLTVTGTGFATGVEFDLGPDVTATTESSTATSAQVQVSVAPDAAPTTRDVKVTNPDFGSSTRAGGFTVAPKPAITTINPGSGDRGQTRFVTITGNNLPASGSAQITVSGGDITVGAISGSGGNPGQLQTSFTIGSSAAFVPRDVIITNTANGGTSTCVACFGVNSLTVEPAGTTNAEDGTLRPITVNGDGLTAATVVTVSLPGNPAYQPAITGTGTGAPATDGSLTRLFNLASAATGDYTVTAVTGGVTLSCIACFKVFSAAAPEIDSTTPILPNNGGQGAVGRTGVIKGKNFSRGETVTFESPTAGAPSGITVTAVKWDTPTQLTITYDIAQDAALGTRAVRVTNIGDRATGRSATTAFTVNAGPTVTGISPAQIGQGAKSALIDITGSNFGTGLVVSFGPGTTTSVAEPPTATLIKVKVTVAQDAVTTSLRDARVTNTDGGSGVKVDVLRVTPAPLVSAVTPATMKPGTTNATVTITGSGFAKQTTAGEPPVTTFPTLIIPGVNGKVTAVSADGSSMTATLTVPSNASPGPRTVFVTNPDKGASSKTGVFAVQTFATKLTSTRNASRAITGNVVTFSGVLSRVDSGARIAGAPIVVVFVPEVGANKVVRLNTDANGVWSTKFAPIYNTKITVRFYGDSVNAPAAATATKIFVLARVTRTSPANNTSSRAGTTLLIKGFVSPNKSGKTVTLMRGTTRVGSALVASNGTFSIPSRLPRGTHTLHVAIAATTGNLAGKSSAFTIKRI